MQAQKVLEQLGYTRDEAKVYLASLELGESHVSDIARKLRRPLSSVQVIIDRLHKQGLLNFYIRKRYKYWVAEQPSHLITRLQENIASVQAIVPALDRLRHRDVTKPHVKVLEGVDEIRSIYNDMLETRQHILGIIPWEEWVALLGRGFMEDFVEKRITHNLRMNLLIPRSAFAEELRSRDGHELRETRYLPGSADIHTTTLIYGSKIAIISFNKQLPTAVVIDDSDIRDTGACFFEQLWAASTSG